MNTAVDCGETAFGPWNPGITSRIPRDIRHLATLYRPENSFTDVTRTEELHDLTGLDCSELVAFRPERLALHELLIRVTADFSVPDGEKIEDLGINFRHIVGVVLARHVAPELAAICAGHEVLRQQLSAIIATELDPLYPVPAAADTATSRSPASRLRAPLRARPASAGRARSRRRCPERAGRRLGDEGTDRRRRDAEDCLSCAGAGRLGIARAPWPDLGRPRHDRGARHGPGLQRVRQRGHRPADRAPAGEGHRRRGLRPAAPPGAAGRHEYQGGIGVRQEHAAPAPEKARRRHRRALERIRAHQSRHLAQAAPRLRHAGSGLQVRRRVHGRGIADRRPEARSLHGAQGPAR